jgi:hypothetical protein
MVWGSHRFDPTSQTTEAMFTLQAVGEFACAPAGASDLAALLALSLLCRGRWRSKCLVRDPRHPERLLSRIAPE